ncbi:MAG TPA: zinc-ribbon domain-containing protein, partial [Candidatus Deferrimicrobium sp.]
MIIECQTCHARFRLDESRIKGRGARVKCRKCGDSIVVLKDSAPAPPAPGGDSFFDLGSAVRDSAGLSPGSPPPVGNLIPFPAPSPLAEPGAKAFLSPALEAEEPGKDEVDLAFDRILSAGAEASSPSIEGAKAEIRASAGASVPVEHEAPAGPEPRPEP